MRATVEQPCYLCGHSHPCMATWSSNGETRYLCHESDHSCYTKHNRDKALRGCLLCGRHVAHEHHHYINEIPEHLTVDDVVDLPPQQGQTTKPPTLEQLHIGMDISRYHANPVYAWEDVQTGAVRMATNPDHNPARNPLTFEALQEAIRTLHARRWQPQHWSPLVYLGSADRELNWRLNQHAQGNDPGPPVNWPGLELALHLC